MIAQNRLRELRRKRGLTQQELADRLNVTVQAVSQWENGKTLPDIGRIRDLASCLGTSVDVLLDEDAPAFSWQLKGELFSPERTFARLKAAAQSEGLAQTYKALQYAKEQHEGQTRDAAIGSDITVPYIQHPLMVAAAAHAMGVRGDHVLAAALLHDVCEECGTAPEDLPFSEEVREIVALLTMDERAFQEDPESAEEAYFGGIRENCAAMLIKGLDRFDNLGTAGACFSPDRLHRYIAQTDRYVLPLLDILAAHCLQYADLAFILKYQLLTLTESLKALTMHHTPTDERS